MNDLTLLWSSRTSRHDAINITATFPGRIARMAIVIVARYAYHIWHVSNIMRRLRSFFPVSDFSIRPVSYRHDSRIVRVFDMYHAKRCMWGQHSWKIIVITEYSSRQQKVLLFPTILFLPLLLHGRLHLFILFVAKHYNKPYRPYRIGSDTCIVATCFSRIVSNCIHISMYRIRQIGGSSCHITQRWHIVHGRLFVLVHDSYDLGHGYPWRCAVIDDAAYVNVQKATLVMVIWKLVARAKLHRSIQTISLLSRTHGK